jgi:hypothetical protein
MSVPQTLGARPAGNHRGQLCDAALGKVFLIIAAVLVVLMVAVMLVSGGQHGPRRHLSSSVWTGSIRYVSLLPAAVSWRP